jgi:hypothetical protein
MFKGGVRNSKTIISVTSKKYIKFCGILSSHSGGYEEFDILGYNAI